MAGFFLTGFNFYFIFKRRIHEVVNISLGVFLFHQSFEMKLLTPVSREVSGGSFHSK